MNPLDQLGLEPTALNDTKVLVLGEPFHSLLADMEERGAEIEHLVFSADEVAAIETEFPQREVHLRERSRAMQSLPERRYDIAAFFGEQPASWSDSYLLALLASCADAIIFEDLRSHGPNHYNSTVVGQAANEWPERRRAYLTRCAEELQRASVTRAEFESGPVYLCRRAAYRPLLAHVHIPKTGGLSVVNLLEKSFPGQAMHIDWNYSPGAVAELPYFQARLAERPNVQSVSSHLFRWAYPSVIGDRLMLYFTVIREPLAQIKSFIRFIKYNSTVFTPEARIYLPAYTKEMSLTEIADVVINNGRVMALPCFFLGNTPDAEPVIRRLKRFFFVGLFERLEDSLWLLQQKAAELGFDLAVEQLAHVNASRGNSHMGESLPADFQKQEDALDNYEPLSAFVEERAKGDLEVYKWVQKRFAEEWEAARKCPVSEPKELVLS